MAEHPFTEEEAEIWTMLRAVGDRIDELPEQKPIEREEFFRDIRHMQSLIMIRVARREYPDTFIRKT